MDGYANLVNGGAGRTRSLSFESLLGCSAEDNEMCLCKTGVCLAHKDICGQSTPEEPELPVSLLEDLV